MNNILKELSSVFQLVSSISVQGDAVDHVAVIRSKLRKIYAELEKINSEQKSDQTE